MKFPEAFKPEVALAFKPDDPRVAPLREFAHRNNWSQAEFSEALQIEAQRVLAEHKAMQTAHQAEIGKLGANGPARVTALKTWLVSLVGAEGAAELLGDDKSPGQIVLASTIAHLERMQAAYSTQGGAPFNGKGREPPALPTQTVEQRWYGNTKGS